jgi:hypothetical protein
MISIIGLACVPAAGRAQNEEAFPYEADEVYNAFNSTFLVQSNGTTFYGNTLHDHSEAFMWGQASDIYVPEEYYARTRDPAALALITTLLNRFITANHEDWSWDSWNDDLEWGIIAFVRGYQITGNAKYLTIAESNWNLVYSRGWDDVDGGGIWENQDKFSKCALSNDPFAIAGCALYAATGNSTYLTESEAAYNWVRTHIFNSSNTSNSLGAPGQVNEALTNKGDLQSSDNGYNSGSFLEAANCLHRLTHQVSYYNDELLDISHIVNEDPIMSYRGQPGNPQYQYWFMKGLCDFCSDNSQWPSYYAWILGNANAAWRNREVSHLTIDDWKDQDTTADPAGLNASSSVTIWQELPKPQRYKIINAYSGLAMDVAGNEADGAVISQWSLSPDNVGQQWILVRLPSGDHAIESALTGMAASIDSSSGDGSTSLVDKSFSIDDSSERFTFVPKSEGEFEIQDVNTGLVLDDLGGNTSNGARIVQLHADGRPNQLWRIKPITGNE